MAQPTTAATTTSLRKCLPAATRVSAQPHASVHQTGQARGNTRERIAAAPNATTAWVLGKARPLLEKVRSSNGRNE